MANSSFNKTIRYEGREQNAYLAYAKILIALSDGFSIGDGEGMPQGNWDTNPQLQNALCENFKHIRSHEVDRYLILLQATDESDSEKKSLRQTVRLNCAHAIIATILQLRHWQHIYCELSDVFAKMTSIVDMMGWVNIEKHCELPPSIQQVMEQYREGIVSSYREIMDNYGLNHVSNSENSIALCNEIKSCLNCAYNEPFTVELQQLFGIMNMGTEARGSELVEQAMEALEKISSDLPVTLQSAASTISKASEDIQALTQLVAKYNGATGVKVLSELLSACLPFMQDEGGK